MSADSVQYQRIQLTIQSPWSLPGQTVHNWHNKFSLTGTVTMDQADAEATALDLWQPIAQLTQAHTSLVGFAYWPALATVSTAGAAYTPGTHAGTGAAYAVGGAVAQQLEVCILARAPLPDKNTRGKTVYLRKWIHDVQGDPSNVNNHDALVNASTTLAKWNTGSGPHSLVPCDPTGGKTGTWVIEQHLYTHQLRRGPRRKKASAGGGALADALQELNTLRQIIAGAAEAAA